VNSYTLTFKQRVIISLLLIAVLILALNIILSIFIDLKTTKNSYINEKQSKVKHFNLNNLSSKDIVFIGSSKTFYHISTNTFKKNGIDIYNFGISGVFFTDYPSLVNAVLDSKPKKVVISLEVESLYSELFISKYPSMDEIKIYYDINKIKFIQSLYRWLINRNTFLVYSKPIFLRIKGVYSRFDIKKDSSNNRIKESINYSKILNCNIFDIKRTNDKHSMLKCSNGDGVLLGNYLLEQEPREFKLLNLESIAYLKKIISMLENQNIEPIIVFEPLLNSRVKYSMSDIYKNFKGVDIIDLTNFSIEEKLWADNNHLNYRGREFYSEYLSTILMSQYDSPTSLNLTSLPTL
jgi:hypothetical protein